MRNYSIYALVAMSLLWACSKEHLNTASPQEPASGEAEIPQETLRTPASQSLTVQFSDELLELIESALVEGKVTTKSMSLNELVDELGISGFERVFPDAGPYEARSRAAGMHRYYTVTYSSAGPVPTKAAAGIASMRGILSAEAPRKIKLRSFNDRFFSNQWPLVNTGRSGYKAGADINVQEVWDRYTTGSPNVIVSVADEGVALDHTDLSANAIPAGEDGSRNFVDRNYNIVPGSHGTHVAGVIAAVSNNGVGIAGIAGGDYAEGVPGAKILSCQIFKGDDGASDPQTANAIKWGADHGAVISQNSWGYYADEDDNGYVSDSELDAFKSSGIPGYLKAAIDYFIRYAGCDADGNQKPDSPMKGGLVFFAAGNEDIDYDPICAYEPVIAVGAYGARGKKAYYSNYGDWVDLACPGGDQYTDTGVYSTVTGGRYAYMQGTSMACPHASGVAALLVSFYARQGLTPDEIRALMIDSADADWFASDKIGAKLDALAAFKLGGGGPEDEYDPVIEPQFDESATTWRQWENPIITMKIYDPDGSKINVEYSATGDGSFHWNASSGILTFSLTGRSAKVFSPCTATVSVTDGAGKSASYKFSYQVIENQAPRLSAAPENRILYGLNLAQAIRLGDYFSDPDGESLNYTVSMTDGSIVHSNASSTGEMTLTTLSYGLETLTVKASDSIGASVSATFKVLVREEGADFELYPTVVTGSFSVRPGVEEKPTSIKVASSTGRMVFDETLTAGAFNPASVDMKKAAPGRYSVTVSYGDKKYKAVILKK